MLTPNVQTSNWNQVLPGSGFPRVAWTKRVVEHGVWKCNHRNVTCCGCGRAQFAADVHGGWNRVFARMRNTMRVLLNKFRQYVVVPNRDFDAARIELFGVDFLLDRDGKPWLL